MCRAGVGGWEMESEERVSSSVYELLCMHMNVVTAATAESLAAPTATTWKEQDTPLSGRQCCEPQIYRWQWCQAGEDDESTWL